MLKKTILCSLFLTTLYGIENSPTCGEVPFPRRLTLRHMEGNGVGYNQGYTTLEGFFAPETPWRDDWLPFLDVRGHLFNDGKPAVNAGLGVRYLGSRVWGINGYYDYRKTSRQQYDQVSMGLESLGRTWDFRINGYLPVGRTKSSYFDTKFDKFKTNFMIIKQKREFAMRGANAEVGYHINAFEHAPLYFAAGPYYLRGEGKTAYGGELRGALDIFNYARIEGSISYDNVFKWIGQGQVSITVPLGKQNKRGTSCTAARGYQRVDRSEIIPVDRKTKRSQAINPVTGQPYFFWFVDNTSHSQGTFESPFNTLLAAHNASSANDVIYVFPGDGTTNGMNQGIILKKNQKLFGAGTKQSVATTAGVVSIPPQVIGLPHIAHNGLGSSTIVFCRDNNEISGFLITPGSFEDGIMCEGVHNVSIHDNSFRIGNFSTAISLIDVTGTATIVDNVITLAGITDDIGVNFFAMQTPATYIVKRNQFFGPVSGLTPNALLLGAITPSGGTFEITQNQFTTCHNVFTGSPFTYDSTVIFNENVMTDCGQFGNVGEIVFGIDGTTGATLNTQIIGNIWQNSASGVMNSLVVTAQNGGNVCLTLKDNTSDLPLLLDNTSTGTFMVDAANNVPNFTSMGSVTSGTCP